MNLIDFTKIGGYRLKQATLKKMQEAYFWILKAFITFLELPEVGNFIISGCKISGTNITDGILYIDGELCGFSQTPGTLETKIKKLVEITSLSFKNGINEPVFRKTTAVVDLSGVTLSAFTRMKYIATDNNFTTLLLTKLNGIQAGAEVNVQSDYNVTNPLSDAFIKNMPEIVTPLFRGEATGLSMSAGSTSTGIAVEFPTVGTSDYIILGILKQPPGSFNAVITFSVSNYTDSFFVLHLKNDSIVGFSNLTFQFVLMPKI